MEEAARRHGKKLFAVGVPAPTAELLERGYVITNLGSDVYGLTSASQAALGTYADATSLYAASK